MRKPKKSQTAEMPNKVTPGPRTRHAIDAATAATEARPVRAYIKFEEVTGGHKVATFPHSDAVGHGQQMLNAFGTASSSFMLRNFTSLERATRGRSDDFGVEADSLNAALALIQAVGPQDELEGALAVQMASNHALTMEMFCRAKSTENSEHLALFGNMAVKLQRTFTAQIEALARLRGKGQQTVRVEHVTIHPGAQAIVGDVHHHSRGAGAEARNEVRPHEASETAPSAQEREALPGPYTQGVGVPVAGHAKRPVPIARRPVSGRGNRESERAQARILEPRDDRDAAHVADDAP